MVVDVLKRIIFRGSQAESAAAHGWEAWGNPPSVMESAIAGAQPEFDYDEVIGGLTMLRDSFHRIKLKFMDELNDLMDKIREAQARRDLDRAEILAAEYSFKRKIFHTIIVLEKMATVMVRRLSTVRDMEEVVKLASAMYPLLDYFGQHLETVSPEAAARLVATKEVFERILIKSNALANITPGDVKLSTYDSEIREILAESMKEANKEFEYLAPSNLPSVVDYEVLEQKLLDYVKKNNGVIKLRKASEELGVPPKLIKETLYRLARKGLITLTKSQNRQASPA